VSLVYDGDTISVTTPDGKIYSIWLKSIDAPESKQNYSKKSRKILADFIEGKDVKVIIYKKDLYDRYIGTVYFNGQDVGLKQIEAGMAWHFKQFAFEQNAEERRMYAQAEQKARADKIGLWEDSKPIAPWDYRSGKKTSDDENESTPTPGSSSTTTTTDNPSNTTNQNNKSNRTYILGPRGGCYYVSESGRKVYVKDKSLCVKQ
jgi:endonuclease YncB( thermonuclease family)